MQPSSCRHDALRACRAWGAGKVDSANAKAQKRRQVSMQEAAPSGGTVAVPAPETFNPPGTPPELSIVVPTRNENGNVPLLVLQLGRALNGIAWEVIFVDDDSADGTAATVRGLARRDPRVRCMRRLGRRGLAGACIEGMLAASAPAIAV